MPDNRPNILFLMTDQQRGDALGAVQDVVRTPNLDALAGDGLRFDRAYCTNPSCVPSRASMITGKWPSQCGAPTYITHLFDDETTFPSLLRQAGYYTAVVGKQHFGDSRVERGYDHEVIVDCDSPGAALNQPGPHDPYHALLRESGFTSPDRLSEALSAPMVRRWTADPEYHIDSFIGEQGVRWLRDQRPADRPWYCCISFPGPHTPYNGLGLPEEAWYDRDQLPLPNSTYEDLHDKPPHWLKVGVLERNPEIKAQLTDSARRDEVIRLIRHAYWAGMSHIDTQIGRVVETLKASGEYETTLILFTSDHGDFLGDFSLPAKGQYLAEALMNVPLIIKPPRSKCRGRVIADSFASTIDIAPTVLSVAGLRVPERMSGTDLSGWWQADKPDPVQNEAYMEAQSLRGLRHGCWKIVHYRGRPYGELYNLEVDPDERRNLWNDPECAEVRQGLERRLIDRMIAITPRADAIWNVGNPVV